MIFYKEKFKFLREMRGLSYERVAKAVGVTKQTVHRWETQQNYQPRAKFISLIAACLQVQPDEICAFGNIETDEQAIAEARKGYVADFGADIYDELAEIHLQQRNLDRVRLAGGNERFDHVLSAKYRKAIEDEREKIWRKMAMTDAMLAIVLQAWQNMSGRDKGELIEFIERRKNV